MNYEALKNLIDEKVYENTSQAITGEGLNTVLTSIKSSLAKGYLFGGMVSPSDAFTAGDENVFFIASTPGKYTDFGGYTVLSGQIAFLSWNGSWRKDILSYNNDQVYGVRHFYENASPDLTRIGSADLHINLPVQSLMRRCVVDDLGVVKYYLKDDDSTKKEDGTSATLDGTDGQVMVEIPKHYRKCTINIAGPYMDVQISLYPFDGAIEVPRYLVGAYEATLDRANNKLSSVVNTDANYRGGNNTADWDGTYRSLLGLPVTNISLTNFRTYGRNRGTGWGCYDYNAHLAIFWLFAVEYATLDSQKTFNASLTAEGYHQGGLGPGVSNFSNWSAYNSYNPIIPCGFTNSLGNATGVKTFTLTEDQAEAYGAEHSESVPSYRGIENPFGHIYKRTDGFLGVGNGEYQEVYVCRDPSKYSSTVTADYTDLGHEATANGYCKAIIASSPSLAQNLRVYGDIFDRDDSGSSRTYFCDYHYHANVDGTTYGLSVGGHAVFGAAGGLACFDASYAPSNASADVGSRLCWS